MTGRQRIKAVLMAALGAGWLAGILLLGGCAVAGMVVGNLIGAASGGAGIYQRSQQTDELKGMRQELADLRTFLTPQLRTTSERLREERAP